MNTLRPWVKNLLKALGAGAVLAYVVVSTVALRAHDEAIKALDSRPATVIVTPTVAPTATPSATLVPTKVILKPAVKTVQPTTKLK